jgi:ABC-type sugar transport system ATPase subunit/ribose/xylose/arabinose/galactoside ABC-type transport system permease subunit
MDATARVPGQADVGGQGPAAQVTEASGDINGPAAVQLVGVAKTFGPVRALHGVDVELRPGEVLALVGENGAGKSTCVNILGGVYGPDEGDVRFRGQPVVFHGPAEARDLGIAVVHQHPGLFGDLSITENLFAGRLRRRRAGLLDHAAMRRVTQEALAKVGLARDPSTPVATLSTSEQQLVEIARALAEDAPVLVLDEPTAALSSAEVDRLFGVVGTLRAAGVATMFVGHRLEEVFRIADRITVLRDGGMVGTWRTTELKPAEIVKHMVGRALTDLYPVRTGTAGPVVLAAIGLGRRGVFEGIDLKVRAGEIVGLAGLVGSGRTELARVLFGIDHATAGQVLLDGARVRVRSSAEALAHGIAYVSEDRRGQSVIEDFSILENATLPVLRRATRARLLFRTLQMALVVGPLGRMKLRFHDYGQPVSTLSGGNQQKVVLAKWLATRPRLLILDEPTQGIDVQAKAEVHRIVAELADQGMAVLLISSDMPEVLGLSDRVLVMRHGRLVAEFEGSSATQEAVGLAATGAVDQVTSSSTPGLTPPSTPELTPSSTPGSTPRSSPPSEVVAQHDGDGEGTVASVAKASGRWWLQGRLSALFARRELGLLAALVILVVGISVTTPAFLSGTNLSSVSGEAALVGVVAVGEMLVLLTRNIDLSVGSVIGLTAYVFGSFVKNHPGAPILSAVVIACGLGLLCGAFNGAVVAYGRVPSIVVTLGTLYVFRGLDATLSDGKEVAPGDIPDRVQDLLSGSIGGPSLLVWLVAAVFVVVGFLLRSTALGREIYQVGSNPDGARLIGLPAARRILVVFALAGLLAGLDGALWATHYGIVDGQSAYGLELSVIAAAVVGGVALRGGSGTAVGVLLGTLLLFVIQNVLELAKVESTALQAFYGAAILLAVALDAVVTRRARNRRPA